MEDLLEESFSIRTFLGVLFTSFPSFDLHRLFSEPSSSSAKTCSSSSSSARYHLVVPDGDVRAYRPRASPFKLLVDQLFKLVSFLCHNNDDDNSNSTTTDDNSYCTTTTVVMVRQTRATRQTMPPLLALCAPPPMSQAVVGGAAAGPTPPPPSFAVVLGETSKFQQTNSFFLSTDRLPLCRPRSSTFHRSNSSTDCSPTTIACGGRQPAGLVVAKVHSQQAECVSGREVTGGTYKFLRLQLQQAKLFCSGDNLIESSCSSSAAGNSIATAWAMLLLHPQADCALLGSTGEGDSAGVFPGDHLAHTHADTHTS
eukprot:GHVS01077480.1.p1 GENE.GHVS01077480.1~~GHVS01077480.1.p1  ORF type:complete len:312 (+),score=76.99 GHVS01077480.1:130-1065(+)